MNLLEKISPDTKSFAWRDLTSQDLWPAFTPSFTSLTLVGALTATGRYRVVGASVQFQVSLVAVTSIASTAGTTYMALPIAAKGLAGVATMTNDTTNIAVGVCHVDTSTSRCYLPSQTASGNTFTVAGWYEIQGA